MPLTAIGNERGEAGIGGKYSNEFAFGQFEISIGLFRQR